MNQNVFPAPRGAGLNGLRDGALSAVLLLMSIGVLIVSLIALPILALRRGFRYVYRLTASGWCVARAFRSDPAASW
jgi:hypothetical protein